MTIPLDLKIIVVSLVASILGAGNAVAQSVLNYPTIFEVTIIDIKVPPNVTPSSPYQSVAVLAKVTNILKDADKRGLRPTDFTVVLPLGDSSRNIDDKLFFWSHRQIKAGQNFIVFSKTTTLSLAEIFSDPDRLEVADRPGVEADVRLVLATSNESISECIRRIIGVLRSEDQPRSRVLAEYVATILASGTQSETNLLRENVIQRAPTSFPEGNTILGPLFLELRRTDGTSLNLARSFVNLTIYFFLQSSAQQKQLSSVKIEALQNYLPWIADSAVAKQILATEISVAHRRQLHDYFMPLENDPRIPLGQRAGVKQMMNSLTAPDEN